MYLQRMIYEPIVGGLQEPTMIDEDIKIAENIGKFINQGGSFNSFPHFSFGCSLGVYVLTAR